MISYEKQTVNKMRREVMFRECNNRISKVEIMWKSTRVEAARASLHRCGSNGRD